MYADDKLRSLWIWFDLSVFSLRYSFLGSGAFVVIYLTPIFPYGNNIINNTQCKASETYYRRW
jgi:hypothetical protein